MFDRKICPERVISESEHRMLIRVLIIAKFALMSQIIDTDLRSWSKYWGKATKILGKMPE